MKESKIVEYQQQIDPQYLPPESLWQAVELLLPEEKPKPKGGAPRKPDHQMFSAIYYILILRTGIQWNALLRCLGCFLNGA